MYCKKCGNKIEEKDKYCRTCGNSLKENNNEKNINYSDIDNINKDSKNNSINFDEVFIKSYMGKKADKIYTSVKNGGINIWALLFGVGYYAYRKMYLVSIIIVIITNIITLILPGIGAYTGMVIGFMFCPLYKWDITKKLRKIKQDNPTATESELIEKAKKTGGTSLLGAISFFLIYIIILIFIYSIGGQK